jgi:hypothetical protein
VLRHPQVEPYAGEFEGRRPASSTGGLGVGTPRSGFCPHKSDLHHTSSHRLPIGLLPAFITDPYPETLAKNIVFAAQSLERSPRHDRLHLQLEWLRPDLLPVAASPDL